MRAGDFDWSDLTFFLAVARAGRLTAAAARLKVEHSTVSRRIGALEEALGAKLFDRRPHGYGLTAAGERLMAAAEGMETLALAAQGEIGGADLGVAGTVRIGAPDGFGTFFLAPASRRWPTCTRSWTSSSSPCRACSPCRSARRTLPSLCRGPRKGGFMRASSPTTGWALCVAGLSGAARPHREPRQSPAPSLHRLCG